MKKILSILTSAVMAAACLGGGFSELTGKLSLVNEPLIAEAYTYGEETKYGDYLYYITVDEDEDGTYDYVEITDCDTSATEVEIPAEINGLSVTSIGYQAFYDCSSLTSITIFDSLTSIEYCAFENCTSLTSILIPDGVTSIGSSAFYNCSSLKNITIPGSVTSIGGAVFENCTSLESINVSECNVVYSSLDGILYNKEQTKIICVPDQVTNITIPDSMTCIGSYVFYNCKNLINITIPNNVTCIEGYAFYGCNKLTSITIPQPVETIGTHAIGYSSAGNVIADFKIYGVSGTAAETYALNNGITFIDVNNTPYMSKTKLSLNVGENYVLEVKNFSGDIVWGSNDSSIATVKDGCVSGVSTGETIVYAIIGDSVLKCNVTVNDSGTVTTPAVTTAVTTTSTTVSTTISIPVETDISTEPITTQSPTGTTTVSTSIVTGGITDVPPEYVTTTVPTTTEPVTTTEPEVQGDISGNGKIDLYDAIEICKSIMGMRTFTDEEKAIADFNKDGIVNIYDAIGIAKELLPK